VDRIEAPASLDEIERAREWFAPQSGDGPDEARGRTGAAKLLGALLAWTLRLVAQAQREGASIRAARELLSRRLRGAWGATGESRASPAAGASTHDVLQRAQIEQRIARLRAGAWRFVAVLDGRTTTVCASLNGLVRAKDDPWWIGRIPPLHPWCRSTVVAADAPSMAKGDAETVRATDEELRIALTGEVFGTAAVTRWLGDHGIVIELHPDLIGPRRTIGEYDHDHRALRLSPFYEQTTGSFSATSRYVDHGASSASEAIERIAVHELGHAVHAHLSERHLEQIEDLFAAAMQSNSTVSQYAKTEVREYFAESFAAYLFEPNALASVDPQIYDLLRTIMESEGLQ
jgi:SPP1 gp7 family putative phage head morphogenesis protein